MCYVLSLYKNNKLVSSEDQHCEAGNNILIQEELEYEFINVILNLLTIYKNFNRFSINSIKSIKCIWQHISLSNITSSSLVTSTINPGNILTNFLSGI